MIQRKVLFIFFFYTLISGLRLMAQTDIQYTQYYANALYLNPSFAGANLGTRAFMAGRLQWPGISGVRRSSTISCDHYFSKYKSGVGILINQNYLPGSGINALDIGLQYAYNLEISDKITFKPGLQIGLGRRSIDYNKLRFSDQYTDLQGYDPNVNTSENFSDNRASFYPDIAAGGVLYVKNAWFGIAAHHMNRPLQTYGGDQSSKIPMETTVHAGIKFLLKNKIDSAGIIKNELSISPTFLYKLQGNWDQLDIGLYGRYNFLLIGIWYRGLPFKLYKNENSNNDAINFLVGFTNDKINIGYSYDFTISKLSNRTGGSHELTMAYILPAPKSEKRKIKARREIVPEF